jgi:uncharacterized membrane protein
MSDATRNAKTDHLLASALNAGGTLAFVLVAFGTVLLFLHVPRAVLVLKLGIVVLMSTPVLRVALAVIAFWVERDYKYVAIAFAVLLIVVLGALLRVAV